MEKLISKKKPFYPITNILKKYLMDFNRWIDVPISYEDLLRFQGSVMSTMIMIKTLCGLEYFIQIVS